MTFINHDRLMAIGQRSGCHQIRERSFYINGRQFPVCARCTGVLTGNITAVVLFFVYAPPLAFCLLCCAVMLIDWSAQYIGMRRSTNVRRLITGVVGGYGLTTVYCAAVRWLLLINIK